MTNTAQQHGFVTRWIHWVSAALIGFGYLKGSVEIAQLTHPSSLQFEVIFALGLGLLFVVRFVWTKVFAGQTRLPVNAPKWEQVASQVVHTGLYANVFGIVLSGLAIAFVSTAPALGNAVMAVATELHEVFLGVLPVLLIAHIAGAIWHKIVRNDGVLEGMIGR